MRDNVFILITLPGMPIVASLFNEWLPYIYLRLHKPVSDWLETLPHRISGLNM